MHTYQCLTAERRDREFVEKSPNRIYPGIVPWLHEMKEPIAAVWRLLRDTSLSDNDSLTPQSCTLQRFELALVYMQLS